MCVGMGLTSEFIGFCLRQLIFYFLYILSAYEIMLPICSSLVEMFMKPILSLAIHFLLLFILFGTVLLL